MKGRLSEGKKFLHQKLGIVEETSKEEEMRLDRIQKMLKKLNSRIEDLDNFDVKTIEDIERIERELDEVRNESQNLVQRVESGKGEIDEELAEEIVSVFETYAKIQEEHLGSAEKEITTITHSVKQISELVEPLEDLKEKVIEIREIEDWEADLRQIHRDATSKFDQHKLKNK